ncbi:hypothetical protein ID866_8669 [Astraeus odoratus]|nr:hypothetical protein ID866_8669 [Astraeus odoratus]
MVRTRGSEDSEQPILPAVEHYQDPESSYRPSKRYGSSPFLGRRRFVASCAVFGVVAGVALSFLMIFMAPEHLHSLLTVPPSTDFESEESYVLGPPTQSFRGAPLRLPVFPICSSDHVSLQKISETIPASILTVGTANDVMTIGNLIYLGMITERVPIIPRFIPSHVGGEQPFLQFSEVFDIARLRKTLRTHILEWDQVKDVNSTLVEPLGCWAVWPATAIIPNSPPRNSRNSHELNLDISWTQAPSWVKLVEPAGNFGSFWSFARLSFPEGREEGIRRAPTPSPLLKEAIPPDDQLLCYDFLYYVSADRPYEWARDYSPAWRFVGKHMRWNTTLEKLAEGYARHAMNVPENDPTPPYISIHVRHGDFKAHCHDMALEECYAPLSVYARRVAEVQEELFEKKGINVTNVIMTSDEGDPEWWAEVRELGWTWVDYAAEQVVEKYGKWYPVLIDAVLQSNGVGFVGTDRSTMTFVALRRVQDWHGGAVRVVKFGSPTADDH